MRRIRPDVVSAHDPWRRYRLHPDHRARRLHRHRRHRGRPRSPLLRRSGLAPHRPSALLLWEADEPNHVEDVADFVETKIAALLAHESQFESTMGIDGGAAASRCLRRPGARPAARARALAGLPYGESFHLITDI